MDPATDRIYWAASLALCCSVSIITGMVVAAKLALVAYLALFLIALVGFWLVEVMGVRQRRRQRAREIAEWRALEAEGR